MQSYPQCAVRQVGFHTLPQYRGSKLDKRGPLRHELFKILVITYIREVVIPFFTRTK
jgi:hypothetical protein